MLPTAPVSATHRRVARAIRRDLRLALFATSVCAAFACSSDTVGQPVAPPTQDADPLTDWALPSIAADPEILSVPTYEETGQAVHPDMVVFQQPWNGARYWMAMTPYPAGNSMFENPSILTSSDGLALAVPDGLKNPVVRPIYAPDYNSDPDLIYDATNHELVMSYRVVKDDHNTIKIITSSDGVHWSDPRVAFSEQNHSAVSQSIVLPSYGPATAWYVDAGSSGCSSTATRVMMRQASTTAASVAMAEWGPGAATDMAVPGYLIWHLKVRYVPSKREYWALIVAFPRDGRGCGADDLFLGHSKNGQHWSVFPQPLLRHQERFWTEGALYRGSFAYDASVDQLAVWFSARGRDERWRLGFMKMGYGALAARLAQVPASTSIVPDPTRPIWTSAP